MRKFIPFLAFVLSLLSFATKADNHEYDIQKVEYKDLVANLFLPKSEKNCQ
ncbi:hypothetical protein [Pseudoalteromonas xiamenensis]